MRNDDMLHIDLFSGIGGFALAADRVWPEIKHIFVDNDAFCQQVLKKHWQNATIFGDIRDFIWQLENAQNAESVNAILSSGRGVVNASRHTTESGTRTIEKGRKREHEGTDRKSDSKSLNTMVGVVSAAESKSKRSLLSITRTVAGIKSDERSGGQSTIETSSVKDSPTISNSSATTATKPSHTTDNAHTKQKNEAEIHGDIRQFIADAGGKKPRRVSGRKRKEVSPFGEVYLVTGGFPCQPFSQAGRRRGTEDDRYLWPEMLRVIRLTKPTWVIAENVRGLLTLQQGVVFEQVCTDLEASGYEVQPFIIPAVAVNAPHRRDRIWFVARNTEYDGFNATQDSESSSQRGNGDKKGSDELRQPERADSLRQSSTDPECPGRPRSSDQNEGRPRLDSGNGSDERWDWNTDWLEVATALCRVDDGLPARVDGFELSKAGHRRERLKALGNAIVPQVAEEIMQAIKQSQ